MVVDPQEKETCLFEVNERLTKTPQRFPRAKRIREGSWTYPRELELDGKSAAWMLGTVVYQWALMEPILLLFLPAQDRLIRSEKVLIYATTLFAQAFSSMVFFNPNTFIALLG